VEHSVDILDNSGEVPWDNFWGGLLISFVPEFAGISPLLFGTRGTFIIQLFKTASIPLIYACILGIISLLWRRVGQTFSVT